jgi:hypothetical protein
MKEYLLKLKLNLHLKNTKYHYCMENVENV